MPIPWTRDFASKFLTPAVVPEDDPRLQNPPANLPPLTVRDPALRYSARYGDDFDTMANDMAGYLPGQRADRVTPALGNIHEASTPIEWQGQLWHQRPWHDLSDMPQDEFQAQIQADRMQKLREQLAILDEQRRQAQRKALGGF